MTPFAILTASAGRWTTSSPTRIQTLAGDGSYAHDRLTDFLETLSERCAFKKWYCGHYHQNRIIENKYFLLYDELRLSEVADTVRGT